MEPATRDCFVSFSASPSSISVDSRRVVEPSTDTSLVTPFTPARLFPSGRFVKVRARPRCANRVNITSDNVPENCVGQNYANGINGMSEDVYRNMKDD